ncbi:MAG: hypothetical protein KAH22_05595 [Thiotrichaceae bacterium]|nr:hypothetical protein [Thiotrichaceae bacterium]
MLTGKIKLQCGAVNIEAEGSEEYLLAIFQQSIALCKNADTDTSIPDDQDSDDFGLDDFVLSEKKIPISLLQRRQAQNHIGPYIIDKKNNIYVDRIIDDFTTDAMHIRSDDSVIQFSKQGKITDKATHGTAHRDGIQLIPKYHRFAGGILKNVTISYANIHASDSKLQGIFGSDGRFENITISHCKLSTPSEHGIALNGLKSGKINSNQCHDNARITLNPTRLGGGTNIWIASELGNSNTYEAIRGLDSNRALTITDNRNIFLDNDEQAIKTFLQRNISRRDNAMVIMNFSFDLFYLILEIMSLNSNEPRDILQAVNLAVIFEDKTKIIYDPSNC